MKSCILLRMKFFRMLILGGAAIAGTVVYKARVSFTAPGTDMVPGESATLNDGGGIYSSLTGPGSLVTVIRAGEAAREAGGDGSNQLPQSNGINRNARGGHTGTALPGATVGSDDTSHEDLTLILAASKGDVATVEKRLAMKSKVDSRDALRRTPLMYAAWNGYADLCSRLLAAGANPEFRDREGNNVFDYAAGRGQLEELRYLLTRTNTQDTQHYQEFAQLIQAAFAGDASLIPVGTGALASVNRINPEGQAPMHIVAGNGSTALIQKLMERGADVNLANSNRQTPLHWAAWNNQTDAVNMLLYYGANAAQTDLAGNTPLIFAAQNGSTQASLLLVKKGADRYIANKAGKTAAITAEDYGYRDLAQVLK